MIQALLLEKEHNRIDMAQNMLNAMAIIIPDPIHNQTLATTFLEL